MSIIRGIAHFLSGESAKITDHKPTQFPEKRLLTLEEEHIKKLKDVGAKLVKEVWDDVLQDHRPQDAMIHQGLKVIEILARYMPTDKLGPFYAGLAARIEQRYEIEVILPENISDLWLSQLRLGIPIDRVSPTPQTVERLFEEMLFKTSFLRRAIETSSSAEEGFEIYEDVYRAAYSLDREFENMRQKMLYNPTILIQRQAKQDIITENIEMGMNYQSWMRAINSLAYDSEPQRQVARLKVISEVLNTHEKTHLPKVAAVILVHALRGYGLRQFFQANDPELFEVRRRILGRDIVTTVEAFLLVDTEERRFHELMELIELNNGGFAQALVDRIPWIILDVTKNMNERIVNEDKISVGLGAYRRGEVSSLANPYETPTFWWDYWERKHKELNTYTHKVRGSAKAILEETPRDFQFIMTKAEVANCAEDRDVAVDALQEAQDAYHLVTDDSLRTTGWSPKICRLKIDTKIMRARARMQPDQAFAEITGQKHADLADLDFKMRTDRVETGLRFLRHAKNLASGVAAPTSSL